MTPKCIAAFRLICEHTVDVGTNIHQTTTLAKTETHLSTSIDYILPTGLTLMEAHMESSSIKNLIRRD
jgi:hypothetical protein